MLLLIFLLNKETILTESSAVCVDNLISIILHTMQYSVSHHFIVMSICANMLTHNIRLYTYFVQLHLSCVLDENYISCIIKVILSNAIWYLATIEWLTFTHSIIFLTLHNLFYQDYFLLLTCEWSYAIGVHTWSSRIQELLFNNIIFLIKYG